MTIEEKLVLCFSVHRKLSGFLHDNLYRPWSSHVLKIFSDDYVEKEDQDKGKETAKDLSQSS
jgi:hypothetical protein